MSLETSFDWALGEVGYGFPFGVAFMQSVASVGGAVYGALVVAFLALAIVASVQEQRHQRVSPAQ